jgi:multidrug efflux pump subunit AcrA (membrane-fusion protein)
LSKHIGMPAVTLLLAGLLPSCSESPQPGKELRAVSTIAVSSTLPMQNEARYAATIAPEASVELAFRTSGYVEWIDQRRGADGTLRNLDAGDAVASGSVLARLRPTEYAARTSEAEAGIKEASAARNEAEAQLLQASAEARRAEIDWQRADRLYRQAAMTKPDYDAARTHYDDALAQLQNAKAAIALQASREAAATAQSREARAAFDDTILKAPFSGVILARSVEKGTLASSGQSAFTLADIARVKASFAVPDTELPQLRLGAQIPVYIEAAGDVAFPGTVTTISPAAGPKSSTFQVEVTLTNDERKIHPGMVASVEVPSLATAISVPAIRLPLTALVRRDSSSAYAVFILRTEQGRSTVHLQSVELGPVEGNGVVIRRGLRPGLKVVLDGNNDLTDGETVSEVPRA